MNYFFLHLFALGTLSLPRTNGQARVSHTYCGYYWQFDDVRCIGGVWSLPGTPPEIPVDTIKLRIGHARIHYDDLKPIPALPQLTHLELIILKSFYEEGEQVTPFPLHAFTSLINRPAILQLFLSELKMPQLTEEQFRGFSGLTALVLDDCDIQEIDVRSFYGLTVLNLDPRMGLSEARLTSQLTTLMIDSNGHLQTFPWDVLYPVSESLQELTLSGNRRLSTISFTPNSESPWILSRLHALSLTDSSLCSIPQSVLDNIKSETSSNSVPVSITFEGNPANCDSDTRPLVEWCKAAASPDARNLTVTCRDSVCERVLSGSTKYWQNQTSLEDAVSCGVCRDGGTSTSGSTTGRTDPSSTTSGTNPAAMGHIGGFLISGLIFRVLAKFVEI